MLAVFLTFMDFLAMIILILLQIEVLPWRIAFAFVVYFLGKGVYYMGDLFSMIDFLLAIFIIAMIVGFHSKILLVLSLFFLGYKVVGYFYWLRIA